VSCGEVGPACGTGAADLSSVAAGTVLAAGSGDDAGDGDAAAGG
jgi:hypothetical protein